MIAVRIPRRVKLMNVDHDGFCGREHHPADEHIGMEFNVISIDVEDYDPKSELSEDYSYVVLHVRSDEGLVLELMEFEVEEVMV